MILLRAACCVLREHERSLVRLATITTITVLCTVSACTDIGTSPSTPVALAFDTLPAPGVAYGDTLRDINGLAAKLTAHAYNSEGREIPNAPIQYFLSDVNAATVSDEDYLIATSDTAKKTAFTVRAQVAGIPSANARAVDLTYRPDSLDRGATTAINKEDTLSYASTDSVKLLDALLSVRVLHTPNPAKPDSGVRPVKAWLVKYRVIAPVTDDSARADTLLTNESSVRSSVDTTNADGVAGRKIRFFQLGGLATVPESVVVEATVRYRGATIRGSPIRFKVRVRKTN